MSEKKDIIGIKKFRERMNFKQNQLAQELNCKTPSVLSQWESGLNEPNFVVIKKLFEMGATVEELFGVSYRGSEVPPAKVDFSDEELADFVRRGLRFMVGKE